MNATTRQIVFFVLGVTGGMCVGSLASCTQSQTLSRQPLQSIVFHAPQLRQLMDQLPARNGGDRPWYTTRNDQQLTAIWGTRTATIDRATRVEYDRQLQLDGRVRDYVQTRTYRTRTIRRER